MFRPKENILYMVVRLYINSNTTVVSGIFKEKYVFSRTDKE